MCEVRRARQGLSTVSSEASSASDGRSGAASRQDSGVPERDARGLDGTLYTDDTVPPSAVSKVISFAMAWDSEFSCAQEGRVPCKDEGVHGSPSDTHRHFQSRKSGAVDTSVTCVKFVSVKSEFPHQCVSMNVSQPCSVPICISFFPSCSTLRVQTCSSHSSTNMQLSTSYSLTRNSAKFRISATASTNMQLFLRDSVFCEIPTLPVQTKPLIDTPNI